MKFVVFSLDGAPLRSGLCPDDAVQQQAQEGEVVFEWPAALGSPMNWTVVDNQLVPKED